MRGRIIRGIAGFYYVQVWEDGMAETAPGTDGPIPCGRPGRLQTEGMTGRPGRFEADGTPALRSVVYECRAKGIFRKDGMKPLPGDYVEMDVLDEEEREGNVRRILPRKNALIRPAVANVDQALVILAAADPEPNLNLLDRFLITMEQQGIPCCICFNKKDLVKEEELEKLALDYRLAGYPVLFTSALQKEGCAKLRAFLQSRTTAVAGPSGVGKSSLINGLQDGVLMETGEVSSKIRRGRHTTRHSELIPVSPGAYIVDTPGFSSIELAGVYGIGKEELSGFFPEFARWESSCRFVGCAHLKEPGCGVKQALAEGKIGPVRYENYCLLYEELKGRRRY